MTTCGKTNCYKMRLAVDHYSIRVGSGLAGNYLVNSDRTGWDIIANTVIIIINEIIIAMILLKL